MSHGVRRVKTSEKIQEEKRQKQIAKIKEWRNLLEQAEDLMSIDHKEVANKESAMSTFLSVSGSMLSICPEYYTLWNHRKRIFCAKEGWEKDEQVEFLKGELQLTLNALMTNPKSYWIWLHRKWTNLQLEKLESVSWDTELALCLKLHKKDARNFHCWNYRRFLTAKAEVSMEAELEYTNDRIDDNFSNYSAWHQRSTLLPKIWGVYKDKKIPVLREEFELVQQAMYTLPQDQSVWLYHRWLMAQVPEEAKEATLKAELESIEELLATYDDDEEETQKETRYALLTKVFLMKQYKSVATEPMEPFAEASTADILEKLCSIDSKHKEYYHFLKL